MNGSAIGSMVLKKTRSTPAIVPHSIHGDVPASVPIESALVHASPVEAAVSVSGGVIDDSGPPDGIEADSSVKSKPLSAR